MASGGPRLPEKILKNWNSKGKDEALGLFQKAYKQGTASAASVGDESEFHSLVYDLSRHVVVEGTLDSDTAAGFFAELISTLGIGDTFPSLLADILAVLDAEVTCNEIKTQRSAFKALVSACKELVGESLLKERLDMDTLELVGLVSRKAFNQKYVKTKTKLFYKQQKFNLFREESEGYSKLVVELGHERRQDVAAPAMLENIKSLIGRFNLDPNRALDVILEAFECHLDEQAFFLPLIEGYPCAPGTFVNIMGNKFQSYHHQEMGRGPPTPSTLYQMAAVLLHKGLIRLLDLYSHLAVSDTKLTEFYESVMDDAKKTARKANVVNLTEKTDEEKAKETEAIQERADYRKTILSLDVNQKLGLCHAFLEQGDWGGAKELMGLLPPFLPMWSPPVAQSLCRLVHVSVEPLYRSYLPRAAKGSSPAPLPSVLVKQCSSFEELYPEVFEMLYCLGPRASSDPVLLARVLRMGRAFLKERANSSGKEQPSQEREDVFRGFLSTLDEVVFPSLSLMQCNCGMAEEAWAMVKQLPYQLRYQLYGYWKNKAYDRHPELIEARTQALSRARYLMKRLTKDNVKPSGRQIGKLSHGNPPIVFDYVLSQIQKYDNFIIPVVDSLKYLAPLAYDVLAYCIIEALGHPQKERLKHDDTNVSHWLQGLASFSANVFKKYPIELAGLLQYVTNQLKAGKSFDLLVMKEVIQKMAGIEISEEVTAAQLEALAGGELLKAEGAYFVQVRNTKKSSQRLREALAEAHLSLPLLLLMAQQRDCIVYKEGSNRHLKLVSRLYDHCQDTLVQFGGFLATHMSPEEYSRCIPTLDLLCHDFNIPADVAFFVLRPRIGFSVSEKFSELEKASKTESDRQDKKAKAARQITNYSSACRLVLEPVVERAHLLHPPRVWEELSSQLYTTFWSFSLYDLHVPAGRYEDEVVKAKQAMQDEQDSSSSKRKKEVERSHALVEKLQEEKQRQEDNNRLVIAWLDQEKDSWFSARVTKNRTITQFLQLCIFPRCRFTASDAMYCAKFVYVLHILHTPNFSTLLFLDRIFSDVSYTIASCTENEASRYGRFMGSLLEVVSRWHASESVYEQECAKTPGFISMMRSSGAGNEKQYLDYENYRHITFKWHFKLTKSVVILLESKDFMQVRNGLIVLTKMLPYYPKVFHLSIALDKRIEKIMEEEKEKRPDLYALAIGYAGMLRNHKQNLVSEAEFHNRDERVKHQQSDGDKTTSAARKEKAPAPVMTEKASTKPSAKEVEAKGGTVTPKGSSTSSKSKPEESKQLPSSSNTEERPPLTSLGGDSAATGGSAREKKTSKEATKPEAKTEGKGSVEGAMAEVKVSKDGSKSASVKAEAKAPKEKGEANERGGREEKDRRGEGKEGVVTQQRSPAEQNGAQQEVASLAAKSVAKASATASRSPSVHNGPASASSSPVRAGQRRQHSGESSPSTEERDAKRRKVEDGLKATREKEATETTPSSEKKDRAERKRERPPEEVSDPKRKKETPEAVPAKEDVEGKERRRMIKVGRKDSSKGDTSTAATVAKRGVAVKKSKEDLKKHASAHSLKTRTTRK